MAIYDDEEEEGEGILIDISEMIETRAVIESKYLHQLKCAPNPEYN